jgi:hypothetical protein
MTNPLKNQLPTALSKYQNIKNRNELFTMRARREQQKPSPPYCLSGHNIRKTVKYCAISTFSNRTGRANNCGENEPHQ